MPRRKTQQPEPLERFVFDDIEVEIRDGDTWPIGRGLHKQKAFETQADKMLESVFDDHFVRDLHSPGKLVWKQLPNDRNYMRSASAFAREMMARGFTDPSVDDDSSLRKRGYKYVRTHIFAMKNALAASED